MKESAQLKAVTAADLLERLDTIVKLMAVGLSRGRSMGDAIEDLERAGVNRSTIAEVVGTTPDSVRAQLSVRRREQPARSTKKDAPEDHADPKAPKTDSPRAERA